MDNNEKTEVSLEEKQLLLDEVDSNDVGIELIHIIFAYGFLLVCIIFIAPKIYIANNIYYVSKEIQDLRSIKEALKSQNSDLQQKLESVKFNFLTLEIEEIK